MSKFYWSKPISQVLGYIGLVFISFPVGAAVAQWWDKNFSTPRIKREQEKNKRKRRASG